MSVWQNDLNLSVHVEGNMTIRLIKYFIRTLYLVTDASVINIANASDGLEKNISPYS